jgi:hypothetical protein
VYSANHDVGSDADAGALWVFAGGASLSVSAVATLQGEHSGDGLGLQAVSPGDLDGDGTNDLLVSIPYDDTAYYNAGAAALWYGPVAGTLPASTADARFLGSSTCDSAFALLPTRAGDLTGDGFDDVLIGAPTDTSRTSLYFEPGSIYIWDGLGGL